MVGRCCHVAPIDPRVPLLPAAGSFGGHGGDVVWIIECTEWWNVYAWNVVCWFAWFAGAMPA